MACLGLHVSPCVNSAFCYFMLHEVPGRLCSAGFDRELEKAAVQH